ncbi:hypothetical protein DH2020_012206 [Rehmannia glutinosa]|uniref:COI1 F-box domain-containing protein n=1 Tax=Rehmannia glutinosa TaxID=99300 RepID=A0ABR0WYR7_REHGL
MMERLSDDLLGLILDKFDDPNDRKSFSQVCKDWFRVEGLHRSTLQVLEPDLIPNFLPRFPNILNFQSSVPIRDSLFEFIASTCPRIQVLNLNYKETGDHPYENDYGEVDGMKDIDDLGISAIARGCRDLREVLLRRRIGIWDRGVASLVKFAGNLRNLDLGFCTGVSDDGLESIGGLKYLEVLNLQGCWRITDKGLGFLAKGSLCKKLRILNLANMEITDCGLIYLKEMSCLEELNLAECHMVTDISIEMVVATFSTLKKLILSWMFDVSDVAVSALARGCKNLEVLDLSGCGTVSATGICAFSSHGSLKELVWTKWNFAITGHDLEHLVFGCSTLERIVLHKNAQGKDSYGSARKNINAELCVRMG